jgi:hypothetical protein
MTLHEPVTLLTDYLLAGIGGALAWRLWRRTPHIAARWLSRALALTAISAVVGGSYHGFSANVSPPWALVWWTATLLVICLVSAALAMALLRELGRPAGPSVWLAVISLKLAVAAILVIAHPRFVIAIADYGSVLLVWAIAAVAIRRRWRGWILTAIGLCVVGAVIQQARVAPSPNFNHNDLYHVLQAFALCAFYRAGLELDR